MASFTGLELLYHSVHKEILSKQDALVAVIHWYMITNGFKCIGIGAEIKSNVSPSEGSELLPSGWNQSQDVYNLQYIDISSNKNAVYLFTVVMVEPNVIINAYNSGNERTASLSVPTDEFVTEEFMKFPKAFKELGNFITRFGAEVLLPLTVSESTKIKPEKSRSEYPEPLHTDPLRVAPGPVNIPHIPPQAAHPAWNEDLPFSIGRGDLTPFGSGGMLFDPIGGRGRFPDANHPGIPGRLPPGAVPPGARFDPFGPPDPDRNPQEQTPVAGPNPDHLQPPGFEDMFS